MTRPIDSGNAHQFARDLLDGAQALLEAEPGPSFSLPRFRLHTAFASEGYADLCRRALVDDPAYAASPQQPLDISVFDYAKRPDLPRARWSGPVFGVTELARGLAPAGYDGAFDVDNNSWQFFDPRTGRGVEALARAGQFPPWVASFPLRNFFHWAYQSIGWRLVHAGTLGLDGSGVMLIGAGGAGKSGTTLSGIVHGLQSVGDDYIAMDLSEGSVSASPVIKLMKQDGKGLARLGIDPLAMGLGAPNWQGKYEFDFETLGKGRRAAALKLKAIILPRIAHAARSAFTPAPSRVAMMGLAPSNLQQLPGGWREGLAFTAEIARRLPAFYLDLSADPEEIAGAIGAFIAGRPT